MEDINEAHTLSPISVMMGQLIFAVQSSCT